jgi:hypothetical protein
MSFTYAQLKSAIQDYTENTETSFVANLPIFIRLAEERILKNVQLNLFQKNAEGTMTSSNQFLTAPSDFLAPFSLSITVSSSKVFLLFKDLDFVQTYSPVTSTTGVPKYYAQFDVDNFLIGPTPDSSYAAELSYFYRPTSLTAGADSGTTWFSENAEMTLLYGSLLEASTYMKSEMQTMQMFNERFMEGLSRLKNLGEAQETSDEYRYGPLRKPKT